MEKNVPLSPRLARAGISFFVLVLLSSAAVIAQPSLVANISKGSHSFVSANGVVYFASSDSLFTATSGSVTFVKKLNENIQSISGVTIGNKVFIITSAGSGNGLWVSTGTAASTVKVATHPSIVPRIAFLNELYLTINNGINGVELWKLSSTNALSMLKDINPGAADGFAYHITVSNGQVFFAAFDGGGNSDLWKTNGTTAGTVKAVELPFDGFAELADVNGTMFLEHYSLDEYDGSETVELWKSQGTPETTQLVKSFGADYQHALGHFTPHKGKLFFVRTYGNPDNYLWVSDGTAAGTYQVTSINIDGYVNKMKSFGDYVVYYSETQGMFNAIAKSDGTTAGTSVVHQLNYMWGSTQPDYVDLTIAGDRLFFVDQALSEHDWPAPDEEFLLYESTPEYTPETTTSLRERYNFPYNNTHNIVSIAGGNEILFTTATDQTAKLWFYDPDNTCAGTGGLTREVWTNISGNNVTQIPLSTPPQRVEFVTSFQGPVNSGDRYGARYRGYLCVPVTGNYKFLISSDDYSELYLSTSSSPADKRRIAYVHGATKRGEFTKFPSQQSQLINLVQGTRYYIEALHKEGGTYDHVTVAMQLPNGTMQNPIQGSNLIPFESNALPRVAITHPQDNQQFDANTSTIVTADASDEDGSIVKVEFYLRNGTYEEKQAVDLDAPYEWQWWTGTPGDYTIVAKAYDNDNGMSTTSVDVRVVGCTPTGRIKREVWTNVKGQPVSYIPVNTPPNSTGYLTMFEGPTNSGDYYGARIRGYLCVPMDGEYTFFIASDDHSELWLSTTNDPLAKSKIAYVTGATQRRQWNKYPSQKSAKIYLRTGRRYYVEVLHKENLGYDHVAVGWQLPNGVSELPIPGSRLTPFEGTGTMAMESIAEANIEESSDETARVVVSPNPVTSGQVTISTEEMEFKEGSRMNVQLVSLTGEIVYSEEISCGGDCSKVDLDLSNRVRPGIYVIKGTTDGKQFLKRLIVK